MNNLCVISCPISTYSGYGSRSRDFVRALIEARPDWDVKILPQRWGNTRQGFLEDHNDTFFTSRIISTLTEKPGCWIQITIPNEFQPVGHYNIGVTAGIETTICDPTWIQGCNKMNLVLGSSQHTINVFKNSIFEVQNNTTKQITGTVQLSVPTEVLFEGVDTSTFYKKEQDEQSLVNLSDIPENFLFLTIGHWMQGSFGHDRKNIAYTVKAFLETFKNVQNPPALLLKTCQATTSIIDRDQILNKLNDIKRTVKGTLPKIYLIHGELSDKEVNDLYNNPKIKCMVSLTKGEGYGRPLSEFSLTGKPIIASKWSGHVDFLHPEYTVLIDGVLEDVNDSAVVKNMILKESQWFKPNDESVSKNLRSVFKEYKNYTGKSALQATHVENNFSYDKMKEKLDLLLNTYVPTIPSRVELNLDTLQLPKLKKIK